MKFSWLFPPGSLDLLNLRMKIRAEGCRHCHQCSAVVSHGWLKGYAAEGSTGIATRGMRFFVPTDTQILAVAALFPFTGIASSRTVR